MAVLCRRKLEIIGVMLVLWGVTERILRNDRGFPLMRGAKGVFRRCDLQDLGYSVLNPVS